VDKQEVNKAMWMNTIAGISGDGRIRITLLR